LREAKLLLAATEPTNGLEVETVSVRQMGLGVVSPVNAVSHWMLLAVKPHLTIH